jgi:hypothetical protein
MKAASYGKSFSFDEDSREFVEISKKLRVLNEIRLPYIGIPMSMQQFLRLTPEVRKPHQYPSL